MRKSRFTDEQVIGFIKQADASTFVATSSIALQCMHCLPSSRRRQLGMRSLAEPPSDAKPRLLDDPP